MNWLKMTTYRRWQQQLAGDLRGQLSRLQEREINRVMQLETK